MAPSQKRAQECIIPYITCLLIISCHPRQRIIALGLTWPHPSKRRSRGAGEQGRIFSAPPAPLLLCLLPSTGKPLVQPGLHAAGHDARDGLSSAPLPKQRCRGAEEPSETRRRGDKGRGHLVLLFLSPPHLCLPTSLLPCTKVSTVPLLILPDDPELPHRGQPGRVGGQRGQRRQLVHPSGIHHDDGRVLPLGLVAPLVVLTVHAPGQDKEAHGDAR